MLICKLQNTTIATPHCQTTTALFNHSNKLDQDLSKPTPISSTPLQSNGRHTPLRFVFSGYSLWLELKQKHIDKDGRGDLDRAMTDAADQFQLGGVIPSPHVTALYGITAVGDEGEVRRIFREDVRRVLRETAEERRRKNGGAVGNESTDQIWPDLDATGIIVDVEFDGVNGGTMVSLMRADTVAPHFASLLNLRLTTSRCPPSKSPRHNNLSHCRTWHGQK